MFVGPECFHIIRGTSRKTLSNRGHKIKTGMFISDSRWNEKQFVETRIELGAT